jgi:FkbM family methyltransferase
MASLLPSASFKSFADSVLRLLDLEVRRYHKVREQHVNADRERTAKEFRCLILACRRMGIDLFLDVGANVGQFGRSLRVAGYRGRILSFEPLSAAHAGLCRAAEGDHGWVVAERMAVGDANRTIEINVAQNSVSSSLLPMLDRHLDGAPESAYVGAETAPMVTLDDYIGRHLAAEKGLMALKIDTQGYEGQVLDGLRGNLHRVGAIITEMSIVPLYAGTAGFIDLYRRLCDAGFRCASLRPAFVDPGTEEVLQVDGLFVRQ